MMWCKAPGASMRAMRGMINSYHRVFSKTTHENRGVPYFDFTHNAYVEVYGSDEPSPNKSKKTSDDK
jgi:hypothetical protein